MSLPDPLYQLASMAVESSRDGNLGALIVFGCFAPLIVLVPVIRMWIELARAFYPRAPVRGFLYGAAALLLTTVAAYYYYAVFSQLHYTVGIGVAVTVLTVMLVASQEVKPRGKAPRDAVPAAAYSIRPAAVLLPSAGLALFLVFLLAVLLKVRTREIFFIFGVPALAVGWLLLWMLGQLLHRGAVLLIDASGIRDLRRPERNIPWGDVRGFRFHIERGRRMVYVDVPRTPRYRSAYLLRARRLGRDALAVALPLGMLQPGPECAEAQLRLIFPAKVAEVLRELGADPHGLDAAKFARDCQGLMQHYGVRATAALMFPNICLELGGPDLLPASFRPAFRRAAGIVEHWRREGHGEDLETALESMDQFLRALEAR